MKQIDDIRRDNMAALAERFGGVAALANRLDRSEAQISQWLNGSRLPSGKRRGMRSETARWIEVVTDTPAGWLDTNHESPVTAGKEPATTYRFPPHHPRRLVQEVIDLAEQINDGGLNQLLGFAISLISTHPLVKANARSST